MLHTEKILQDTTANLTKKWRGKLRFSGVLLNFPLLGHLKMIY